MNTKTNFNCKEKNPHLLLYIYTCRPEENLPQTHLGYICSFRVLNPVVQERACGPHARGKGRWREGDWLCVGGRHQHRNPPHPALRAGSQKGTPCRTSWVFGVTWGAGPWFWNLNHIFQSCAGSVCWRAAAYNEKGCWWASIWLPALVMDEE